MMAAPMKSRVLVVEDDANLSTVLRENLTFEGFDVRVVGDGAQALEDARAFCRTSSSSTSCCPV